MGSGGSTQKKKLESEGSVRNGDRKPSGGTNISTPSFINVVDNTSSFRFSLVDLSFPEQIWQSKVVEKGEESKTLIKIALGGHFLFQHFSSCQLDELIGVFTPITCEKGDVLMKFGSSGDYMYVIEKGCFEHKTTKGKIRRLFHGEIIGDISALYNNTSENVTVSCLENAKLWSINRNVFRYYQIASSYRLAKTMHVLFSQVKLLDDLSNKEKVRLVEIARAYDLSLGDIISTREKEKRSKQTVSSSSSARSNGSSGGGYNTVDFDEMFFVVLEGHVNCYDEESFKKYRLGFQGIAHRSQSNININRIQEVESETSSNGGGDKGMWSDRSMSEESVNSSNDASADSFGVPLKMSLNSLSVGNNIQSSKSDPVDLNEKEMHVSPLSAPFTDGYTSSYRRAGNGMSSSVSRGLADGEVTLELQPGDIFRLDGSVVSSASLSNKPGQTTQPINRIFGGAGSNLSQSGSTISRLQHYSMVVGSCSVRLLAFNEKEFKKVVGKDDISESTFLKYNLLKDIDILNKIQPEKRQAAMDLFTLETFKNGEVIAQCGDPNSKVIVIRSGEAAVWHHPTLHSLLVEKYTNTDHILCLSKSSPQAYPEKRSVSSRFVSETDNQIRNDFGETYALVPNASTQSGGHLATDSPSSKDSKSVFEDKRSLTTSISYGRNSSAGGSIGEESRSGIDDIPDSLVESALPQSKTNISSSGSVNSLFSIPEPNEKGKFSEPTGPPPPIIPIHDGSGGGGDQGENKTGQKKLPTDVSQFEPTSAPPDLRDLVITELNLSSSLDSVNLRKENSAGQSDKGRFDTLDAQSKDVDCGGEGGGGGGGGGNSLTQHDVSQLQRHQRKDSQESTKSDSSDYTINSVEKQSASHTSGGSSVGVGQSSRSIIKVKDSYNDHNTNNSFTLSNNNTTPQSAVSSATTTPHSAVSTPSRGGYSSNSSTPSKSSGKSYISRTTKFALSANSEKGVPKSLLTVSKTGGIGVGRKSPKSSSSLSNHMVAQMSPEEQLECFKSRHCSLSNYEMRSYFSTFAHSQMGKKELEWRSSIQFMKDKCGGSRFSSGGGDDCSPGFMNLRNMSSDFSGVNSDGSNTSLLLGSSIPNTKFIQVGQHVGSEAVCNGSHMDCSVIACGTVSCFVLTRAKCVQLVDEEFSHDYTTSNRLESDFKWSNMRNIGLLGNGTFATVYLIESKVTERKYAMKVLLKSNNASDSAKRRIENEISMLQKINSISNHTSLFYEHGENDSIGDFLLLEYVPGGDLRRFISPPNHAALQKQRGVISSGYVAGISHQSAKFYIAAMSLPILHLHRRGIAYRDLKPENVMIDRHGYPKLVDFGLSKQFNFGAALMKGVDIGKTYTLCGTPEYMAPEVVLGRGHNHAVDWWSLGIVLYEMVVGMSPFGEFGVSRRDQNQLTVLENIVNNRPYFPIDMEDGCKGLIQSLLVSNPSLRLNCGCHGDVEFQEHDWFHGIIDWYALNVKQMTPPWFPNTA